MRRPLLVLLALAVLAVGCSDSDPAAAPVPSTVQESTTEPPTTAAATTTLKPTTTTTGVPRTTVTTALSMGPGDASLGGTVSGPAGPVDGAVVHVERLVGKAVVSADVTTSGGGSWQLASILGGSYRVRAFKTPDLAPSPVETFFLGATERRNLEFKLTAAGGERITAVVNPSPPRVDQAATLTVTVGIGSVDAQGRSVLTPRPGVLLVLSETPGLQLESSQAAVTDGTGSASWGFRCLAEGASTFVLTINNGSTRVNFPACQPPGATPTTRRA